MNIYSLPGHKVIFKYPKNGYSTDQEHVNKYLTLNEIYTIEHTIVDGFSTSVSLVEFPKIKFNSAHFEDLELQDESLDKEHPDYYRYN
jgi:hypothetical protein